MARIFVTGSSTGLGLMTAQLLIEQGHRVVLHGRNRARADDAMAAAPGAEAVVIGDLSNIREMRGVADEINRLGRCDAVIHNAGVGYREARRVETEDGLPQVFAVNVLAPYLLSALIERPDRLVYLSSGMHHGVTANFDDLLWRKRRWQGSQAYAESKLYDTVLAFAVARRWPTVRANALEPGWVATSHGGSRGAGRLEQVAPDTDLARRERGGPCALERRILLSQGPAGSEPGGQGSGDARTAVGGLCAPNRRGLAELGQG